MPEPNRRCPECQESMELGVNNETQSQVWMCRGCDYSEPVAQDVAAMLDPNQGRMEL